MGVPAFYRWLSEKYPKIIAEVLEQRTAVLDGIAIPLNLMEENPNGIEYDNLYVDMNGLIHPCSHPEDREAPTTESEMYVNVTMYVDRLFAAVRPRKVLFLAIDGVAPRAKMNQQRSRRFRAVKDAKERQIVMDEVMQDMKELGLAAPEGHGGPDWDSNVITPGTEFMSNLSVYLRYYVLDRLNKDAAWRNIKVILSDASEPGEGEHKIMSFIRAQRAKPGYDPNQSHILHGLDADLIMLALATHEPHFTILRELVSFGGKKEADKPERSEGQKLLDAQSTRNMAAASAINPHDEWLNYLSLPLLLGHTTWSYQVYGKPLQALNISVLRDYLQNEFKCLQTSLPFGYDFERVIDDFVFLCFFVGNDFLPHLPSLDIRDGAIDFLIESYKEMLPSLGDYVTAPGGNVNLRQADVILGRVGEVEDEIFRKKKASEENEEKRRAGFAKRSVPWGGGNQPKDRAMLERDAMMKRMQGGEWSNVVNETLPPPLPPPLPITSRTINNTTATTNTLTITTTGAGVVSAIANKEAAAALKLKMSLLGKRGGSAVSKNNEINSRVIEEIVGEIEIDSENKEKKVKIEGDITSIKEEMISSEMQENDNDSLPKDDGEEEMLFEGGCVKLEQGVLKKVLLEEKVVALTPLEAARAKEDMKKRMKSKEMEMIDGYKKSVHDAVCLHEVGWKDRYYNDPFKKENLSHGGGLKRMCSTYVEGLCWVMKYYYQGVPSWNWYYPFHYAPFASDLINIDSYAIQFDLSEPFRPVEQLLAVLPSESRAALPRACQPLMIDPSSPIIDLYGSDAPIDPNGKHLPWLWVLLLPFVDEVRVVKAYNEYKSGMTVEERRRNAFGVSVMFVHQSHKLALDVKELSGLRYCPAAETDNDVLAALRGDDNEEYIFVDMEEKEKEAKEERNEEELIDNTIISLNTPISKVDKYVFDHTVGDGISGCLSSPPHQWFAPVGKGSLVSAHPVKPPLIFRDLINNQVMCLGYSSPIEVPGSHKSELLPGVRLQECKLNSYDLMPRKPPKLNRGGFNIIDLALGLKKGPNSNNILNFNGNGRGGDGTGNYPNQRPHQQGYPQQFLQQFQQQQQQYNRGSGGQQGYGYDMAQNARSGGGGWSGGGGSNNGGRGGGDRGDIRGMEGQQFGGRGRIGNEYNRGGQQPQQQQQQGYQVNQYQGRGAYPPQQQLQGQGGYGQGQVQQDRTQQQRGYQQQPQYSGSFLPPQPYATQQQQQQQQLNSSSGRFSFSTNGSSGANSSNGYGTSPSYGGAAQSISMDSMKAQLAQTLAQQGGRQGQQFQQGVGVGGFSSLENGQGGKRQDSNHGGRGGGKR